MKDLKVSVSRLTADGSNIELAPINTDGVLAVVFDTDAGMLSVSIHNGVLEIATGSGRLSIQPVASNVVSVQRVGHL